MSGVKIPLLDVLYHFRKPLTRQEIFVTYTYPSIFIYNACYRVHIIYMDLIDMGTNYALCPAMEITSNSRE